VRHLGEKLLIDIDETTVGKTTMYRKLWEMKRAA
jgi:hypothetical protein